MEDLNLHDLGSFIKDDIFVIRKEVLEQIQSRELKKKHAGLVQRDKKSSVLFEDTDSIDIKEGFPLIYEGDFEKGILIVYEGSALDSGTREFLMKILGAVHCSLKDIALIASNDTDILPKGVLEQLNPNKCIVFGRISHPFLLQGKRENYEITDEGAADVSFLFANDLKEIEENVPLKKKLWAGLQVFFHINK